MKNTVLCILSLFLASRALAQEIRTDTTDTDSSGVVTDQLLPTMAPILLFDDQEKKEKQKKSKRKKKKNIYFGEKTKRKFIRQSLRDKVHYQIFHYTTRNKEVDPYIRDVYWFNTKDRVIRTSAFDPSKGYLLHGPYEKRIDDAVVETGMFFFGTKHGRWMTYDSKNILKNKAHFYEGWPEDSRITYHNQQEQKLEKIIPIEYDLREGNFFHFYEDGQLAVMGEYHYGEKVGLWTEYWNANNGKTIKKREIQYQEEPFSKNFRPYIRAEWDQEGNMVYRNSREY